MNVLRSVGARTGLLIGLSALTTAARAAVDLSFSPTGGTPAPITVPDGGAFDVTLYLRSDGTVTTGLNDVHFTTDAAPSKFTLASRTLTGSNYPQAFPATFSAQALPTTTNLTQATPDDSNGLPTELGAGNFLVATYHVLVDPATPAGSYTFSTTDLSGEGYAGGAATGYSGGPYHSPAAISVVVTAVPEPAALALITLAAPLACRRRRRELRALGVTGS